MLLLRKQLHKSYYSMCHVCIRNHCLRLCICSRCVSKATSLGRSDRCWCESAARAMFAIPITSSLILTTTLKCVFSSTPPSLIRYCPYVRSPLRWRLLVHNLGDVRLHVVSTVTGCGFTICRSIIVNNKPLPFPISMRDYQMILVSPWWCLRQLGCFKFVVTPWRPESTNKR